VVPSRAVNPAPNNHVPFYTSDCTFAKCDPRVAMQTVNVNEAGGRARGERVIKFPTMLPFGAVYAARSGEHPSEHQGTAGQWAPAHFVSARTTSSLTKSKLEATARTTFEREHRGHL
jgi:hypothetical protein